MTTATSGKHHILQQFADEYFAETGKESATTKEIARWAIKTGRWEAPTDLALRQCRQDFSRAMREQYITDDNGQPVRAKHVARIVRDSQQLHLWSDIRHASHKHMAVALQQRREQIVGDCRQLHRDVNFYNSRHPDLTPIQMVFDFTDDVEEGMYSGEYGKKN